MFYSRDCDCNFDNIYYKSSFYRSQAMSNKIRKQRGELELTPKQLELLYGQLDTVFDDVTYEELEAKLQDNYTVDNDRIAVTTILASELQDWIKNDIVPDGSLTHINISLDDTSLTITNHYLIMLQQKLRPQGAIQILLAIDDGARLRRNKDLLATTLKVVKHKTNGNAH